MSLRVASRRITGSLLANSVKRTVPSYARTIQSSASAKGKQFHESYPNIKLYRPIASVSPFSEPTSPNPAITKHAATTESLHTYGTYLMQCLPKFVQQFSVLKDELTLYIPPSGVVPVLTFLRDHSQCQFKGCMDVSGADYPDREKRFEVVYHLLSVSQGGRIRVKTYAGEADPVPSAVPVFRGADWYEREAWDLFGIFFEGHPDL